MTEAGVNFVLLSIFLFVCPATHDSPTPCETPLFRQTVAVEVTQFELIPDPSVTRLVMLVFLVVEVVVSVDVAVVVFLLNLDAEVCFDTLLWSPLVDELSPTVFELFNVAPLLLSQPAAEVVAFVPFCRVEDLAGAELSWDFVI